MHVKLPAVNALAKFIFVKIKPEENEERERGKGSGSNFHSLSPSFLSGFPLLLPFPFLSLHDEFWLIDLPNALRLEF